MKGRLPCGRQSGTDDVAKRGCGSIKRLTNVHEKEVFVIDCKRSTIKHQHEERGGIDNRDERGERGDEEMGNRKG